MWNFLTSCRKLFVGRRVLDQAARLDRPPSILPPDSPVGNDSTLGTSVNSEVSGPLECELDTNELWQRLQQAQSDQECVDLVAEAVGRGMPLNELELMLDWLEAARQIDERHNR